MTALVAMISGNARVIIFGLIVQKKHGRKWQPDILKKQKPGLPFKNGRG
jgi:hypothetical protein